MNIKRLLNTKLGIFFISVILGLGLAALFRQVCNEKNCITFNGPIIYNKQFNSNLIMAFQEVGEDSQSRIQKL